MDTGEIPEKVTKKILDAATKNPGLSFSYVVFFFLFFLVRVLDSFGVFFFGVASPNQQCTVFWVPNSSFLAVSFPTRDPSAARYAVNATVSIMAHALARLKSGATKPGLLKPRGWMDLFWGKWGLKSFEAYCDTHT